jgi:hypothetical protein
MARAFDEQELMDRVDNDLSFLADTVQMLESDGRALMAELKTALAAGDAPAIGGKAHALKGSRWKWSVPERPEIARRPPRRRPGSSPTWKRSSLN